MMRARNALFDTGLRVKHLPRPVASVGNLTTGGTGKTPVVQWLYDRLRTAGHHPAVLTRGYKSKPGAPADEQAMLASLLAHADHSPIIQANPSRLAASREVLRDHPKVTVFILDDGFQHRRLARDFDLV